MSDRLLLFASTVKHNLENLRQVSIVFPHIFALLFLCLPFWCPKMPAFIIPFWLSVFFNHSFKVGVIVTTQFSFFWQCPDFPVIPFFFFCLCFWPGPHNIWDLSSLTRDQTCAPAVTHRVPTTGPPGSFTLHSLKDIYSVVGYKILGW